MTHCGKAKPPIRKAGTLRAPAFPFRSGEWSDHPRMTQSFSAAAGRRANADGAAATATRTNATTTARAIASARAGVTTAGARASARAANATTEDTTTATTAAVARSATAARRANRLAARSWFAARNNWGAAARNACTGARARTNATNADATTAEAGAAASTADHFATATTTTMSSNSLVSAAEQRDANQREERGGTHHYQTIHSHCPPRDTKKPIKPSLKTARTRNRFASIATDAFPTLPLSPRTSQAEMGF